MDVSTYLGVKGGDLVGRDGVGVGGRDGESVRVGGGTAEHGYRFWYWTAIG